jgi:hypothetical protein
MGSSTDLAEVVTHQVVSGRYRHVADRCNTLCYGSPNLSLITIISGLVMHDATGLINSESSQRHFDLI